MRQIEGNIWDLHDFGYPIVIPTNIGWRKDGTAIFGRGIAETCADRYPETPARWGKICQTTKEATTTFYDEKYGLFYFPTKPLNLANPHLSWKSEADIPLIKKSLAVFIKLVDELKLKQVITPLVGCGNGGLSPQTVKPIMEANLDNRFVLIRPCFKF